MRDEGVLSGESFLDGWRISMLYYTSKAIRISHIPCCATNVWSINDTGNIFALEPFMRWRIYRKSRTLYSQYRRVFCPQRQCAQRLCDALAGANGSTRFNG